MAPADSLEGLGFTADEARLYRLLLPMGETSFAAATEASKLHPQIVHRLIEKLVARGAAQVSTKQHRKHVRMEDPRLLLRALEDRVDTLAADLPALIALQKASSEALVRVSRGNEAVVSLRRRGISELPRGGTFRVLNVSGDQFFAAVGDQYERLDKLRLQKQVTMRGIAYESQRTALRERKGKGVSYRFLPEHFGVPSSTNIFEHTVGIILWGKTPIVIEIESKDVAESHRRTFDALWKVAKEK